MFKSIIDWYMGALETGGYPLVVLLMAMESSIIPLPSEVVIPPVAHLAHTNQTQMSIFGIVIAGAIGSWLGATLMYVAARLAGRPLILRYGKYFRITADKIEGAERWSAHYGWLGIFISRLLPVVRHLIGIPAGIVRMNYTLFSIFTFVGSAIWCAVLCYVGIKMGQDEKLMRGELHRISLWMGGSLIVLAAMYYFFVQRQMKRRSPDSGKHSQ